MKRFTSRILSFLFILGAATIWSCSDAFVLPSNKAATTAPLVRSPALARNSKLSLLPELASGFTDALISSTTILADEAEAVTTALPDVVSLPDTAATALPEAAATAASVAEEALPAIDPDSLPVKALGSVVGGLSGSALVLAVPIVVALGVAALLVGFIVWYANPEVEDGEQ